MLERLKDYLLRIIEKDCVKSELEGKVVYLKKSQLPVIGGEWKEINPPINEDRSWNLINLIFGGKKNFIILLIILAITGGVLFQFYNNFNYIETLTNNPCIEFCMQDKSLW